MGRVLGVLFRYRSIWHKCAACIRRMQYTKGLGLSQQAFCNAKMAFVYTDALLATLGKQGGNGGQSFFATTGNDDRFLDLDVVDGAADEGGEGEIQEFASEFQ